MLLSNRKNHAYAYSSVSNRVNRVNPKAGVALGFLLLLLLFIPRTASGGEDKKLILKAGFQYDDNLFEQTDGKTGALATRLYLDSNLLALTSRKSSISLQYQLGLKKHLRAASSDSLSPVNPVINRLALLIQHQPTARTLIGLYSELKSRSLLQKAERYLATQTGYLQGQAQFFLDLNLTEHLRANISLQGSHIEFQRFHDFDCSARGGQLRLNRSLSSRSKFWFKISAKRLQFRRKSLVIEKSEGEETVRVTDNPQIDFLKEAAIGFRFYRGVLITGGYSFRANSSNSCGYSFKAHRIYVLLGKRFTSQTRLQFHGLLEQKSYTEAVQPCSSIFLLSEQTTGSMVIVNLSRKLSSLSEIEIQLALYRGECLERRRFYTRGLYGVALSFRL